MYGLLLNLLSLSGNLQIINWEGMDFLAEKQILQEQFNYGRDICQYPQGRKIPWSYFIW